MWAIRYEIGKHLYAQQEKEYIPHDRITIHFEGFHEADIAPAEEHPDQATGDCLGKQSRSLADR